MIDMPLRDFGKAFRLEVAKEVLPYSLYTEANVARGRVPLEEARAHVAEEDRARFLANAEAWGCLDGEGGFDLIAYSSEYCRLDCSVLRQGYEVFRGWMLEHTELDIVHYITLQSLAADYILKEGCYEGVPQLSGVPQAFISQCIVGGRVMTNGNTKHHVKGKVADFDACSLYPSAMRRLGGYLKGAPKVLEEGQLTYEFLRRQDGYFVKVRVAKVGKCRQFPLASVIGESGTRDWTNDLEGKEIHLDRTGLEDLIEFQGVEVDVLQGYYFDEGRSAQLGATIQHLYDLRKRLKREKNPAQLVMKLLMNSAYGRSILKPIETDTVVVPEERHEGYVSLNYHWIESSQKVGDRFYIKRIRSVNDHRNHAQAGVEVLSMSKRIMNEVMCLAEDEGQTIYYQDTDSLHINSEAVPPLAEAFQRRYGRELVGEEMGQFHVDFDLAGAAGDIYAKESLFLGKKCYLDVLESTDKEGRVITGEHIRMKGVPSASIRHAAAQQGVGVLELYRRLHAGKAIDFDLTCGGQACGFKYNRDLSVRSYRGGEFSRRICFAGT